jgi:hypothetical protein
MSSLSELRKELKDMRKTVMPTPVSRMKKTDVARELERMKGSHHKEDKADVNEDVQEVKEVKKTTKTVPKKVQEKPQTHLVEQSEKKKPEVSVVHSIKYSKGSVEAKDKMSEVRSKRGLTKEV